MSGVPLIATELVAVRGRISGQRPAVQRDAVPGDAQHVRHPGIVIEARAMVLVLLHDAEDAGWRLASRRRTPDPKFLAVSIDPALLTGSPVF